MHYDISRRRALKTMIGTGVGSLAFLPFLSQLKLHAAGKMPKRLVFVCKSSAIYPEDWRLEGINDVEPGESTSLINESLKGAKLPFHLNPMEEFKDQLTMIQDLSGKQVKGGHGGGYACLNLTGETGNGPSSISIDCLIGNHLESVFGNIGFSTCGFKFHSTDEIVNGCIGHGHTGSSIAKGMPMPLYLNTEKCLDSLFGSVASNESKEMYNETSNIMDFITNDVKNFSRNLSGSDKAKLDAYTYTLESVKNRRRKIVQMGDVLRKWAPDMSEKYKGKTASDRISAHFDTMAACLITGLTNVSTYHIDNLGTRYDELGLSKVVHGIGHKGTSDSGIEWVEGRRLIIQAHLKGVAQLANKLKSIPEGNGNMLDNTVIIYMTNNGNGHHGSPIQMPMLMVGGKNIIKNNGRYIQYPKYGAQGHLTLRNFYHTLLHSFGKPMTTFGRPDKKLTKEATHIDQTIPLHDLMLS